MAKDEDAFFQGNAANHSSSDMQLFVRYRDYFSTSPLPTELKLSNFAKYIISQDLSRFLARNEIFQEQLDVPGVVVESAATPAGTDCVRPALEHLRTVQSPAPHLWIRHILRFPVA